MLKLSLPRLASRAAAARSASKEVPDVLVTFGNQVDRLTFVSHPGVMAVAKLLEMSFLTEHRAVLTQENVEAIRMYDEVLAQKAQIAVDEGLAVNFQKLDFFDREEFVDAFKREKKVLEQARQEVLSSPEGVYSIPACVSNYLPIEIPRKWRCDLELTEEMTRVDPGLRAQTELRELIVEHITTQKQPLVETASRSAQQTSPQKQLS